MNKELLSVLTGALTMFSCTINAQEFSDNVRLNQVGFYPNGPKKAIVVEPKTDKFYLVGANTNDTVYTGSLESKGTWEYSDEVVSKADFSKFTKEGSYRLYVPGVGSSFPFEIKKNVHFDPAVASLKFYYYQRASVEIVEPYAEKKFARKAGHPDNEVYVHASAATDKRPEGTVISSTRGWYDAGDYNKYIVNSGITTYTLLNLYESFPKYFDTLNLNIPESRNKIPDLLDEILWNLRWMITMQDLDGGVYHKLTNANFDGSIMPDASSNKRWVVMKSTAASLDFAAVMAQASRVLKKHNKSFADSCLKSAVRAYSWAKKNPSVLYNQPLMNAKFNPDIQTGAYDDNDVSDEFQWAAMELWVATGKLGYFEDANIEFTLRSGFGLPNWQNVNTLGLYTVARQRNNFPEQKETVALAREKVISMANVYRDYSINNSAFEIPMGQDKSDFNWGSNSFAGNQGMLLLQAYLLTNEQSYLDAAIATLDYLLGRNGTNYSYLTGFGEKSTRHPHHRPSEADGVDDPVPGMVAGGPNPGQEDAGNCGGKYTSNLPAKSYIDNDCSYASNEVAINWNAPFAFIAFGVEAAKSKK
jgi:endoglucanase